MKKYSISAIVSYLDVTNYYDEIEAETPEEAVDIFMETCPYTIEGHEVLVTDHETGEDKEVEI